MILKRILAAAALALVPALALAQSATLLPNGEQQFADANGAPYAAGSVCLYTPNTLVGKQTWQDGNETVPNTIPCVTLDSAGRALIYGQGQYRQILKDAFGNTIWDKLTFGGAVAPAAGSITNSQLATMANNTVKGNVSGIVASPQDLTQTQLTALINVFSAVLSGAVPASAGGTQNFLRADATWAIPSVSSSSLYTMTSFTATGVYTTAANSTTSTIYRYTMKGGGAGGGGATGTHDGGGGGGGEFCQGTFTNVAAGVAIAVTINSGGAGGTAGNPGSTGGTVSIGAPVSVTASAGTGGGYANGVDGVTGFGGVGGTGGCTGAIFESAGGSGGNGSQSQSLPAYQGGTGGDGGGRGGQGAAGVAGVPRGSGGGGAGDTSAAGGNGVNGFVNIERISG